MKQVHGVCLSLLLTTVALAVTFLSLSFSVGPMTILLLKQPLYKQPFTIGRLYACRCETEDKSQFIIIFIMELFIALVTIFGTLLCMVWGYFNKKQFLINIYVSYFEIQKFTFVLIKGCSNVKVVPIT